MSVREASRVFGLHSDTVRKMLRYAFPPGHRRRKPPKRPEIGPYTGVIDEILHSDMSLPKKPHRQAHLFSLTVCSGFSISPRASVKHLDPYLHCSGI